MNEEHQYVVNGINCECEEDYYMILDEILRDEVEELNKKIDAGTSKF